MRRNLSPIAALVLAAAFALGADKSTSSGARNPTPTPAQNSCKTCVERRPILDPRLFTDTRIYEPDASAAYGVALRIPATIDRLHCFCECAENPRFHHKTLLTCFTDSHGAGCGVCIHEAMMASQLKQKGASDDEIVQLVESMFRTEGHPPTHAH